MLTQDLVLPIDRKWLIISFQTQSYDFSRKLKPRTRKVGDGTGTAKKYPLSSMLRGLPSSDGGFPFSSGMQRSNCLHLAVCISLAHSERSARGQASRLIY